MLSDLIKKLQDVGLTPKVVICDQGGCNRGLFKRLGISHMKTNKTYIEKDNSKIHFLWDYSHLIKSTRNMLLKYKFKVNRGIVDFKYVQEVYEIEKYQLAKSTKLTKKHVYPNSLDKMSVSLATQTLSSSVAGAISTHATFRYELDKDLTRFREAGSTSRCIKDFNDLFDIFDSNDEDKFSDVNDSLKKLLVYYLPLIQSIQILNPPEKKIKQTTSKKYKRKTRKKNTEIHSSMHEWVEI